jgi:hypothetical protein
MLFAISALVVVGSTIWVGFDASQRDWTGATGSGGTSTATWVVGCILLWILVFPLYLAKRGRAPLKSMSASTDAGASTEMYRECPHCKEGMRRDAQVCPHCRQASIPWHFHEGRWWYRSSEQAPWQWLDERTRTWIAEAQ